MELTKEVGGDISQIRWSHFTLEYHDYFKYTENSYSEGPEKFTTCPTVIVNETQMFSNPGDDGGDDDGGDVDDSSWWKWQ